MPVANKFGKKVPADGFQQAWQNVLLTSSGLTAQVFPAGGTSGSTPGANPLWLDVYGVAITSNDTAIEQVTLSDGSNSVTWFVGAPSGIVDVGPMPYRFNAKAPLVVSAGAVTAAKTISVAVRGVVAGT